MPKQVVKFIDLFSGMGGIRLGFEQAFKKAGYTTECILTSEIKEAAIKAHEVNFPGENIEGDVTKIETKDIEDFDFLLAGFPCQASVCFSGM
ncbi:MAG: DNA cytosine methyltransferase [Lachnospiraceae bacterium]|nr:DNA cytosine methyltransferase [Lachnospiraceae bacterium]